MNLFRMLAERASRRGDAPALDFEGRSFSSRELFREVGLAESFLRGLGVGAGDRVAVCLPKSPEVVLFHLAVLAIGGVSLPLNDRFTAAEIRYFLEDSGARLFVTDGEGTVAHREALGALPDVTAVVVDGGVAGEGAGAPACAAGGGDTAMICYTSGTTGRPKGAMLSHESLVQNMEALREAWRWRERDVLLHALPLFHVHGLVVALHGALNAGSPVVMHDRFDAARVAAELETGRCTIFMGVPTMYRRLVRHWDACGAAPHLPGVRLFVSGSAPLPEDLFHRFRRITGHAILERYGMTETGMITSNPYEERGRVAGTAGYPLRGVEIRVAGDSEDPGEVQVRGSSLFSGYWNAPEKTAAAFDGEWFRTGDLGRLDRGDGGRLILSGRTAELIISGGFNIYPREVEEELERHSAVAEAAVVGLPDDDLGEHVVAVVVLTVGAEQVGEEDLVGHCQRRLTAYKCPARVLFREAIPKNAMGKIRKDAVRDSLLSL
jgi:malonyl-CoA/methylmalonyl-CoA synthetase